MPFLERVGSWVTNQERFQDFRILFATKSTRHHSDAVKNTGFEANTDLFIYPSLRNQRSPGKTQLNTLDTPGTADEFGSEINWQDIGSNGSRGTVF